MSNILPRKTQVFTIITPIPDFIPRQLAIDILHSHSEVITLNPLVLDHRPIKAPRNAPNDEFYSTWYEIDQRIQFLPGIGKIGSGKITFKGCFHDMPWGLQTHIYAPMNVNLKNRYSIAGNQPGFEPPETQEMGLAALGAPASGLYLRDDIEIKSAYTLAAFIKSQLKAASKDMVERIITKAELIDSGVLHAMIENGKLKTVNPQDRSSLSSMASSTSSTTTAPSRIESYSPYLASQPSPTISNRSTMNPPQPSPPLMKSNRITGTGLPASPKPTGRKQYKVPRPSSNPQSFNSTGSVNQPWSEAPYAASDGQSPYSNKSAPPSVFELPDNSATIVAPIELPGDIPFLPQPSPRLSQLEGDQPSQRLSQLEGDQPSSRLSQLEGDQPSPRLSQLEGPPSPIYSSDFASPGDTPLPPPPPKKESSYFRWSQSSHGSIASWSSSASRYSRVSTMPSHSETVEDDIIDSYRNEDTPQQADSGDRYGSPPPPPGGSAHSYSPADYASMDIGPQLDARGNGGYRAY